MTQRSAFRLTLLRALVALTLPTAALADVAAAPDAVVPLAPGQAVPSAPIRTVSGEAADLAELVREQGALLVFYRGGW
jgi:hypothetical protein